MKIGEVIKKIKKDGWYLFKGGKGGCLNTPLL
jgi:predicted RNA binding protein YcfA (HicA-like mRNA interferase family)